MRTTTRTAILKRVPDRLLEGLPSSDQNAIRNTVGKTVKVVPEDDRCWPCLPGQEEVEFREGDVIHTIWVDANDLECVTESAQMQIAERVIERMADWRFTHWHCTVCHHEWDGRDQSICDWCGSPGKQLPDAGK